jgi:hypothetical protein
MTSGLELALILDASLLAAGTLIAAILLRSGTAR